VAGIGVLFVFNEGEKPYRSLDRSGRLMVFGNANNDDYLDGEDVSTLEKIIAEGLDWKTEYPLADANQDGVVDENDVEWVKRMVNREKMKIFYVDYYNKEQRVKSLNYPVKKCAVVGTNMLLALQSIGATSKIIGTTGEEKDPTMFSDLSTVFKVSDSSVTRADDEKISTLKNDGLNAVFTMDSTAFVKNEETIRGMGVDVVRMATSNIRDSVSAVITLGYMLELEERAGRYSKFCDDVYKEIETKAGTIKPEEIVTCINVTMSNSIGGLKSDYHEVTEHVGASNLFKEDVVTKKFEIGDEWLLNDTYDADFIIHYKQFPMKNPNLTEIWDSNGQYFTKMNAYKNGKYSIINSYMPLVVRMAYTAQVMYPELYGESYGDVICQYWIDNFQDNMKGSYLASENLLVIDSSVMA